MKISLRITAYDLVRRLSAIARDAAERPAAVQKPARGPVASRRVADRTGAKRVER